MSRLDGALSPYLLSHAHQSVDWFPWSPDAFAEAAKRDCPVMISLGYSTCHWCHVMSRESFDDPAMAELLNQKLVAIKVDREEHPEVDALYMAQAQAFTDHLGWPLTVFTTPEGAAFYAQTYLPPEPRGGQPSLTQVVEAVTTAWAEKREDVLESSRALVGALADAAEAIGKDSRDQVFPSTEQLSVIVDALIAQEDIEFGGFGGAPKFPVSPALSFLQGEGLAGSEPAAQLVARTLETYAGSDLRDAVEGGFFRYSTMRDFSEPHYERMLYDNAGLLSLYSRQGDLDTAAGIVSFLHSTLLVEGGFGSAQDSESIIEGLPSEGGYYLLDAVGREGLTPPKVDDKVITGWNGLALRGLADAHLAGVPGDPGALGDQVATWLLDHHVRDDGTLVRLSRRGIPGTAPATLEDYGALSLGLLELGIALGEARFVAEALRLVESIAGEELTVGRDKVMREKGFTPRPDIQEGASPSGISLFSQALVLAATLRGDYGLIERARGLLAPHVSQAMLTPLGAGGILQVLASLAREEREIIVVADGPSDMIEIARRHRTPGTLVLCPTGEQAQQMLEAGVEILRGRTDGSIATAYVCHRGVCQLPAQSAEALLEQLQQ
ncbi:MAG: DUF255 domain-containing protein [Pontimonas sp.]|nr:DUF255 domain-containing protein [Pontimonas sp.]